MIAKARVCESCGVKLPFGVARRRKDDKLICDGCLNDRPGMPRSQVTRQGAKETTMDPTLTARRVAALTRQAEFPPKKKDSGDSKSDSGSKPPAGGSSSPAPPPAGHPAGPHMLQQGMGPNMMGMHPMMGMPGMMPGMPMGGQQQQPTMQQFAPDQQSDLIVRVCPFCGSGHLIGRSDGSIECGYDNTVFTVTVMPSHPFQPLVNPDGSPFSMPEDPNADPHPQIGTASPASTPGDGPADALAGETPAGQAPAGQSPSAPVPPGVPPAAPGAPGATSQPGAPGGGPLDHAFEQAVAEAEGGAPGVPEDQGDSDDPQAADHDKDAPDAKKGDEDDDNKPPWLQKKKSALFGWDPNDPEDAEPYVNDFRVHNCASVLKQATRAPEYLTASGEYLGEDAYVAYLRDRVLPHA